MVVRESEAAARVRIDEFAMHEVSFTPLPEEEWIVGLPEEELQTISRSLSATLSS